VRTHDFDHSNVGDHRDETKKIKKQRQYLRFFCQKKIVNNIRRGLSRMDESKDVFSIFLFYYPIISNDGRPRCDFIKQHTTHIGSSDVLCDIGVMKEFDVLSSIDSDSMLKTMYLNKMNITFNFDRAPKPFNEDVLNDVPDSISHYVSEFLKLILCAYDDANRISEPSVALCKSSEYAFVTQDYHCTATVTDIDSSKIEFSILFYHDSEKFEKRFRLLLYNLSPLFDDGGVFGFIDDDENAPKEDHLLIKWSVLSTSVCSVFKTKPTMKYSYQPNVTFDQKRDYDVFFSNTTIRIHEYLFGRT
jgi:hypothetical protein